jgi:SnoaL-like domain
MDPESVVKRFSEAWNVQDPEARRRLIEETCTDATEIVSPYGEQRGIEAQVEMIAQFRSQFPNARVTWKFLGKHHGWVMDSWTTEFGDGRPPLRGIDVTQIDENGRYVRAVSFSPVPAP